MLIALSAKNKEIVNNIFFVLIYLQKYTTITMFISYKILHYIEYITISYSLHITQYKLNILMISLIIVVCNVILQFTNNLLFTMLITSKNFIGSNFGHMVTISDIGAGPQSWPLPLVYVEIHTG